MTTQEQAVKAIELAIKHVGQGPMASSARVCLSDAVSTLARGDWDYAKKRAIASVAYSVGMFHQDYSVAVRI